MANFIQTVEGDIVMVAEAAWAQTKAELMTLGGEVLAVIKADISALVSDLENGKTFEEIETELLNLWSANRPEIISALSSGALQILIAAAKTAVSVA